MVDMAHIAGLVAGGVHPNPCEYADYVTTTTHKTMRGPRGGVILARKEHGPAINKSIFPGIQGGPLMHVVAAKAVVFGEALKPEFAEYAGRIKDNATVLAKGLSKGGLRLVSGGTDTHLILIDTTPLGLTGAEAETALEAAGVATNKNAIPYDQKPPKVTSGIRIGTAALTTRGFGPEAMAQVAELMVRVLSDPGSQEVRGEALDEIGDLCRKFPLDMGYSEI
jgi:glycine hydroxymethyltransferase